MKKKILIIIICIILIVVLIICMILINKYRIKENIDKNEITDSGIDLVTEKDENIMIIGITKQKENINEVINDTSMKNDGQSENITGTENINNSTNKSNTGGSGNGNTIVTKEENNETEKSAAVLTEEVYTLNSNIGTLYIPKTRLNTSVYCNPSVSQMERMPCFLYTSGGINKKGITLIVGHNRRNGKMFANNKKIEQGDEFYFTDLEGTKLKYIVYSKFITKEDDTSFLNGNFDVPTIALSCCTDASDDNRIIILGKSE